MENVKEIVERLKIANLKCSRGWLQKWKLRYNVKQLKVIGESGDVQGDTVRSWKERLPQILQGYAKENIWNIDETGIFWIALPERGFVEKGSQCKGTRKANIEWITRAIQKAIFQG